MSRNSQPFEKYEGMLTVSQQHATCLYPVPAESNPRLPIIFIYVSFHALGLVNYDMIYLLIAIGLTPGGSSTVHIYTQTVHRTTQ
jgi:hypothetical protein